MIVCLVPRIIRVLALSLLTLVLIATHALLSYAASHTYVRSGNGKQATLLAYATWYSFDNNSGQKEIISIKNSM